jgi:two-component system sensor histidine kinase/response regulator
MTGDSTNSKPADQQLVNWTTALDVVAGDRLLLVEVVDAFLQEAPQQMNAVDESIRQRDAVTLRRSAHTLKGSLRYFGAQAAFDIALALEMAGMAGQFEGAAERAASLRDLLQRVLRELADFIKQERRT